MDLCFPEFPIFWIFIIIIILVILSVTNFIRTYPFPDMRIVPAAIFASVLVSFILIFSIGKYDDFIDNTNLFTRRVEELAKVSKNRYPQIIPLLHQYVEDFACRRKNTLLFEIEKSLTGNNLLFSLIRDIDESNGRQQDRVDFIPNIIWYGLFFITIILSLIVVANGNISPLISLATLAVIWLPILIIYYLYVNRFNILYDKINRLNTKLKRMSQAC